MLRRSQKHLKFLTQGDHNSTVFFQDIFSIELFLCWIQITPLVLGEAYSHVLESYQPLKWQQATITLWCLTPRSWREGLWHRQKLSRRQQNSKGRPGSLPGNLCLTLCHCFQTLSFHPALLLLSSLTFSQNYVLWEGTVTKKVLKVIVQLPIWCFSIIHISVKRHPF